MRRSPGPTAGRHLADDRRRLAGVVRRLEPHRGADGVLVLRHAGSPPGGAGGRGGGEEPPGLRRGLHLRGGGGGETLEASTAFHQKIENVNY